MKLAASAALAVLVLVVALPFATEAQPLDPPYQLSPGESPPPPPPPPTSSGSFPANNPSAWGHRHPECPAANTFSSCPSSASAGQTIQNCNGGGITLNGSNITLSCVNLSTSAPRPITCNGTCQNIRITRATLTGGGSSSATTFLNLSSSYGGSGPHTMLIEKSVLQNNRVGVILGGGKFDASRASIEPGFAFVARRNIFRSPAWPPGSHSEHVALVESTNGALFENNVFDCDSPFNGGNPCNTAHMLGQPANGATIQNITIRGNRFIGDKASTNGYEFTFDNHPPDGCMQRIQFLNNVIERFTTAGVFNNGSCGNISSRAGSSCSGNTVNGAPFGC